MIKFRWYYDLDKEEEFLNEMSKKGYFLESYKLGFYQFKKTNNRDYTYRVDLMPDDIDKQKEYLELVKDSGAELIQTYNAWAYFRKKGDFELYTDVDSQITLYTRIKNMFQTIAIAEGVISISQLCLMFNDFRVLNIIVGAVTLLLATVFFYQTYKVNNKISKLKEKMM